MKKYVPKPLFKGTSVETGSIIHGALYIDEKTNKSYILPNRSEYVRGHSWKAYEVIDNTIGVHCGQLDAYNRDLYTGDKVKVRVRSKLGNELNLKGTIEFSVEHSIYYIKTDNNIAILFKGDNQYKISFIERI